MQGNNIQADLNQRQSKQTGRHKHIDLTTPLSQRAKTRRTFTDLEAKRWHRAQRTNLPDTLCQVRETGRTTDHERHKRQQGKTHIENTKLRAEDSHQQTHQLHIPQPQTRRRARNIKAAPISAQQNVLSMIAHRHTGAFTAVSRTGACIDAHHSMEVADLLVVAYTGPQKGKATKSLHNNRQSQ